MAVAAAGIEGAVAEVVEVADEAAEAADEVEVTGMEVVAVEMAGKVPLFCHMTVDVVAAMVVVVVGMETAAAAVTEEDVVPVRVLEPLHSRWKSTPIVAEDVGSISIAVAEAAELQDAGVVLLPCSQRGMLNSTVPVLTCRYRLAAVQLAPEA